MTPEQEAAIDWSLYTWEGSRIRQHNEFRALSAKEKLRQMDELCRLTDFLLEKGRLARERAAAARLECSCQVTLKAGPQDL